MYIESVGEYQQLHLTNGDKLLTYKRLKELVLELPEPCFKQVHRSYAVNLHHIKALLSDQIVVSNNDTLPVSRTNRKKLLRSYEDFMNTHHKRKG